MQELRAREQKRHAPQPTEKGVFESAFFGAYGFLYEFGHDPVVEEVLLALTNESPLPPQFIEKLAANLYGGAFHVKDILREQNDTDAFREANELIAEKFWDKRHDPIVRTMLARLLVQNVTALDPHKDAERDIPLRTKNDIEVITETEGTDLLCSKAERRTVDSMYRQEGFILNGLFYVKGKRDKIALTCLSDTRLQDGTILLKGVYYLADKGTRDAIRKIFDNLNESWGGEEFYIPEVTMTEPVVIAPERAVSHGTVEGEGREALGMVLGETDLHFKKAGSPDFWLR